MDIEKFISPLIASQFPQFYREEGPNFIAFVKAYYEWMESSDNPLYHARRIPDYTDIDDTAEEFIKYFKNEFINSIPENIAADKRLVIKHILDLYRSKGTPRSYELLFRILFNEDIELYFPGKYLFTSSEANWITPKYIEISDSPYLFNLINKKIYSASGSAIVENYSIQKISGKVINSLELSNLRGNFKFGEKVFCDDLYVNTVTGDTINLYEYGLLSTTEQNNYEIALNVDNAPIIFGSLSSVSITNGGAGYRVGDIVNIFGSGKRGIAKVSSVTNLNGRVSFTLVDGGFGYTTNAVVTVSGGSGVGATFKVGDITNKTIFNINTDVINDYATVQLDIDGDGFDVNINNLSGTFTIGDNVTSSANVVELDVTQGVGIIYPGSSLSNSALGISGLYVYISDGSLISVTGTDTNLTNANLVSGVLLHDAGSNTVTVNTVFPKKTISANATVTAANTSVVSVNNADGGSYFVANAILNDITSGASANIVSTDRNTNWNFPKFPGDSNLNGPSISNMLTSYDLEVGTIVYLTSINPGEGYSSDPVVAITEPDIYNLRIDDGKGGFYGYNAIVTAKASTANGVVTSVDVIDSGYGYVKDETLTLNSPNNNIAVTGVSVVDTNGIRQGYWQDNKSFSSDFIYLQDSDYYQTYAYEIAAKRMLSTYEKAVRDLVHPSGFKLFGKYKNSNEFMEDTSELISFGVEQQ